jgi:hypothetical protein
VKLEGQNPISDEAFIDDADIINGSKYNDTILGHNGNDTLNGHGGNDILIGGEGSDRISGGSGNDLIINKSGFSASYGGSGDDLIISEGERANIQGGSGNDLLIDSSKNSTLAGDTGNDTFLLFSDRSVSSGGSGEDLFFLGNNGHHTIKDYDFDAGDRIYLSTAFLENENAYEAMSNFEHTITDKGDTLVKFSENSALLFEGVRLSKDEFISQVAFDPNNQMVGVRVAESLNSMTPEQVSTYVDGNVTDLASARLLLKRLSIMMLFIKSINHQNEISMSEFRMFFYLIPVFFVVWIIALFWILLEKFKTLQVK